MNLSIIQVYAPTADYEDDIIEEFYEKIEDTTAKIPKKDFMIIQGDWNEKLATTVMKYCLRLREDMDWAILIKEDTGC